MEARVLFVYAMTIASGMDQIGIFRRAASANVVKEVKQRYEAGQ